MEDNMSGARQSRSGAKTQHSTAQHSTAQHSTAQHSTAIIPKKIHWCWLSGDPVTPTVQRCIDSWKRVMPDYEIVLWDTKKFDVHSVKFVEQAYNARKWAFAADYIRLYALYHEGGIYLDSDVMVFRRFDDFLHHSAFTGIEYQPQMIAWRDRQAEFGEHYGFGIQSAIIGAEKGNAWIKDSMEYYLDKDYVIYEDGRMNCQISPTVLAHYAANYGFQYDISIDEPQILKNNMVVYPFSVFSFIWGKINLSTYAIHLGEQAWMEKKRKGKLAKAYQKLCGSNRFWGMIHYYRKSLFKSKNV